MDKIPFKDKKKVSIFLTEEREREIKKKAIDEGMSLSEYLDMTAAVYESNTNKNE